jgi:hypothetical protein
VIGKDIARQAAQKQEDRGGGELIEPTLPSSEIDVQIRTANAYPREIKKAMEEACMMATVPEIAGEMWYRVDRGGKTIEGPSIRLAEIVAYAWRNLRIADRVVSIGDRTITVEGVVFDLERNIAVRREVTRRITNRDGRRYTDDMITVTAAAACSIARRNAIFAVVPQAFVNRVLAAAKEAAGGKRPEAPKESPVAALFRWAESQGIEAAAVLRKVGRVSPEEVTAADLDALRGYATAIREGETTAEAIFGATDAEFEDGGGSSSAEPARGATATGSVAAAVHSRPPGVAQAREHRAENPEIAGENPAPGRPTSSPQADPAKPAAAKGTPSRPKAAAGPPTMAELTGEMVMHAGIKHASTIVSAVQRASKDRDAVVALVRLLIEKVPKDALNAAAEEDDPATWAAVFSVASKTEATA